MANADETPKPSDLGDETKENNEGITSFMENDDDEGETDDVTHNMENLTISKETESSTDTSETQRDEADGFFSDLRDAWNMGKANQFIERPEATMPVARFSTHYNMQHKKRGFCVIIAYSEFGPGGPGKRECAPHDARICKAAFSKLKYNVKDYWNLPKIRLQELLEKLQQVDHSERDSLVIVFMSHGGVLRNKEFIWTYDAQVYTSELWKYFTAKECPSLAGKPKMFFIQACRGEDVDKGVNLRNLRALPVQIDSKISVNVEEDYAIPLNADMLMMWASYQGMFAFKSKNYGLQGSVFLHFLAKVLLEDAHTEDLVSMLTRVTREVAIHYESYVPGDEQLNQNKQIPQTVSTLMRKVQFLSKDS